MEPTKTIWIDGFTRPATVLLALAMLAGCGATAAPPCPDFGANDVAPSAGCLAIRDGGVLVVRDFKGRLSPPGGSAEEGETAQCAAFRETWEETGLQLAPTRLLSIFDTGFHLYHCEYHGLSGEIDPPPRLEVREVFYLPPAEFEQWEWRFPGQERVLREIAEAELRQRAETGVNR